MPGYCIAFASLPIKLQNLNAISRIFGSTPNNKPCISDAGNLPLPL